MSDRRPTLREGDLVCCRPSPAGMIAAPQSHMNKAPLHIPLTLLTALLLLSIAALAGSSLVVLRRIQKQSARATAARTVLRQGQLIAGYLASQPAIREGNDSTRDWADFSNLLSSLHTAEAGLQYVSVTRDDVVLFHKQTSSLGPALPSAELAELTNAVRNVRLGRKLISVGAESMPVVTFSVPVEGPDGAVRLLEVAMRRDAVEREERAATGAISSMFRISLLTVVVAFLVCVLLVVWMMQREARSERLRREEEHLAFSGVLANGIVHDFRNPMSAVKLDAQMLDREVAKGEGTDPERIAELTGRIRNTVDRMDGVFEEFLYLSKPSEDASERIELSALIRDCVAMMAPRFERAGVTAAVEPASEDAYVPANQASLRRAIINVLTNAEQFSERGGKVRVRVALDDRNAIVEVSDSGPGIPRSERKRVFQMFVSSRPEGTGLGLFLARAAVEKSAGTIAVVDSASGGTLVRIVLPRAT